MISASYRDILRIVIPMVLSNMAFTVMQFTDRVLLARYSSEAIQAALPAGLMEADMKWLPVEQYSPEVPMKQSKFS